MFVSLHDDRIKKKPILYAKLVYGNNLVVCSELEYTAKNLRLDYRYKVFYVNYILRTKNSGIPHKPPEYAFISKHNDCSSPWEAMQVQSNKPEKKYTYGVCLHKALFDLHEPQLLVDWVELNVALGAEIITVYLQDVSESYYKAMIPYIKKGIVEVLDWNLKPPLVSGFIKDWGQTATINECLLRNIHRVKYLALIDTDEFIVPQENITVIKMIEEIEKIYEVKYVNPASFIFYNTFVYNDGVSLPEVKTATKCPRKAWPRYYTYTQRVEDPEQYHDAFPYHKMIIRTRAVISAWYHWPVAIQDGYTSYFFVPSKYGLTLHYRTPVMLPKRKSKRNFEMSRYFKRTLTHLQNDCNASWLNH